MGLIPSASLSCRAAACKLVRRFGHRYVELFDYFSPAEFVAFNTARQKASGMQKQKGVADVELNLVARIEKDLGFGTCDLLHPRLMYSGVLRYHWSQRSSMDHLLLHARYERMEIPEPGEIEAQLPSDYYAVRFYSRKSFGDNEGNRIFVRHIIERMLESRDVVLLDSPFAVDDHANVEWMKAAGNGSRYNNRLVRAEEWMVPRNNLDVQSRIIARSTALWARMAACPISPASTGGPRSPSTSSSRTSWIRTTIRP